MNRETKEFETKNGFKVVANTYITGKEQRDIRDCYIGEADVNLDGLKENKSPLHGIKGSTISKSEDIAIKAIIVSVTGKDEDEKDKRDVLQKVWDLPSEDFDEVIGYINTITNPKKEVSDTSKVS